MGRVTYSCEIWYASSRVCARMRQLVPSSAEICCRTERTNTAVLPMPELAWQMTSVPRIACGMTSNCTCEGCSKPQSVMARNSSGFRRKSLNEAV